MRTVRALLVLVAAAPGVEAQQVAAARAVARLVAPQDFARFDEQLASDAAGSRTAVNRFAAVMGVLFGRDGAKSFSVQTARVAAGGERLLVRGTTEQHTAVTDAMEQLRKDEPLRVRLQCSWVTVPQAAAKAKGLKLAEVTAADENAVNAVLREATKAKGALVNLPEVVAAPLAPFVVEPAGKAAAGAAREQTLRLRGEMVPLADHEVGVAMHVVRGELPADRTVAPPGPLRELPFRLATGKVAMSIVFAEGDTVTVLVVRCIDASPAPLPTPAPVAKPTPPGPR
jgi:hypothetical protein